MKQRGEMIEEIRIWMWEEERVWEIKKSFFFLYKLMKSKFAIMQPYYSKDGKFFDFTYPNEAWF